MVKKLEDVKVVRTEEAQPVVETPKVAITPDVASSAMGRPIEGSRDYFGKNIDTYDAEKDGKLPVAVALEMIGEDGGGYPARMFKNINKFNLQPGDTDRIIEHCLASKNTPVVFEMMKNSFPGLDRKKTLDAIIDTKKNNLSELIVFVPPSEGAEFINRFTIEKAQPLGSFAGAIRIFPALLDGMLEDKVAGKLLDAYTKSNLQEGKFNKEDFLAQTKHLASKFKNPGILQTLADKYPEA